MKPLVMDLGMHDGRDTAAYLRQGYRVVAVECDPRLVERARKLFKAVIEAGDLIIEECGIAATDGERTFYRSQRVTEWSSFDVGLASRVAVGGTKPEKVDAFTVKCRSPWFLFEEYEPAHYMKIDLEGNDKCVLATLAQLPLYKHPTYISAEIMVVSDIDAVAALGYNEFCVVDQSQFLGRKDINPSGPFGAALPGPWVSAEEAARIYSEGRANPLSWFDVHGRLAA